MEFTRSEIDAKGVRAMAWVSGSLIDASNGWRTLYPEIGERRWAYYGKVFDQAVVSPRGDVVVLVATVGTKGLVLNDEGRVVRELNRSYYQADAYRYPVALFTLPDGQTGLIHCPERYNQLEVEVALTGEHLTESMVRKPSDIFHSRLAVSSDGLKLLSAGWQWQPWDSLHVYNLAAALEDPTILDSWGDQFDIGKIQAEVAGACFLGEEIMISTTDEENELNPNMLACWSPAQREFIWKTFLPETPGDLVAYAGGGLALNGYAKLYDAKGRLVAEWPDLDLGHSYSSITWEDTFQGPGRIAVDPTSDRFAYTDGNRVIVIEKQTP